MLALLKMAVPLLAAFSDVEKRFGLRPDPEPPTFRSKTHSWPPAAVARLTPTDKVEVNCHLGLMMDLSAEWADFAKEWEVEGADGTNEPGRRLVGPKRISEASIFNIAFSARAPLRY